MQVVDPRRRQITRYHLPAILTLAVAAILCNHRSLLAIAEWGAAQSSAIKQALGFPMHVSTLQRLFRRLDRTSLEMATLDDDGTPLLTLRPYQEAAYARFLDTGAVCVLGKPQTGKPYLALKALAELTGPKLVLVPTRTLVEQWRARIALYLTPDAANDVVVSTYAGARKHLTTAWSLVVFDEAHHLPADFALEAATALTSETRIGLSATPFREDGQIDLLPALTGFPVYPHKKAGY